MNKSLYGLLLTLCYSVSFLSLSAIPKYHRRKNTRTHQNTTLYKAVLKKRKKAAACTNGQCAMRSKKNLKRNRKAVPRKVAVHAALHKQVLKRKYVYGLLCLCD